MRIFDRANSRIRAAGRSAAQRNRREALRANRVRVLAANPGRGLR